MGVADRFPTAATSPKPTEDKLLRATALHQDFLDAATTLELAVPEGRWKALALTALEESLMWANKAIYNQE